MAAGWLRQVVEPDWHKRYDRRVQEGRLPPGGPRRDAYVVQLGGDGFRLLDALDDPGAPPKAATLPGVAVLRRVWASTSNA